MTVALVRRLLDFVGLSTDSKPASAPAGAVFYETDSGARYVWDGAAWRYAPWLGVKP